MPVACAVGGAGEGVTPGLLDGFAVVANHVEHRFHADRPTGLYLRAGRKVYVSQYPGVGSVAVLVETGPGGARWREVWTTPERLYDVRVERVLTARDGKRALAVCEDRTRVEERLQALIRYGVKPKERTCA